jgi:hypothetical protein
MFHCFKVDAVTGFLVDDFNIKCDSPLYIAHSYIALFFVFAYALGIPLLVGWKLFRRRGAIKAGRGPSEFEMLYKDFKPEHCLWEVYGMLEKATLVGLLGFLFPGKILQASVGLLISTMFLLAFSSSMPYNNRRTNILAILSQSVKVFSYFSTILLKIDLQGEVLTPEGIGLFMVGINLPMAVYFVADVLAVIREDLAPLAHAEPTSDEHAKRSQLAQSAATQNPLHQDSSSEDEMME